MPQQSEPALLLAIKPSQRLRWLVILIHGLALAAAIQSIMKIQLHEAQPFYSGHTPPSPYVRVSVHCLSSRGFFV